MLASCLRGALAQRLVRKLCPACRRATTMTMDTPGLPPEVKVRHLGKTIWEAGGCEQCLEGFRGRSGVFEWLPVDSGLRGLIRGVESVDVVRRAARDRGMVTLMEDALAGVLDGVTTVGELLAIT
jgi:type II secretory ATPase GspE/PulE/Tfp pilus assembly ATPase PilB-like protein